MATLDNTTDVETPERIRFRYRLAGPTQRALAYLIDLLIRGGLLAVIFVVVQVAMGGGMDDLALAAQGVLLVALFALEWAYYVLWETLGNGTTPGKRVFGLRVVKEGGFPIGFLDSVLRNLLRAADFLPAGYLVGGMAMAGDRRFRRLGDRVAGTMVILEDRGRVSEPLRLSPPAAPGELEALGRQPPLLSAAEREALELFLRRRDLSPARRLELADMVAPIWARRMGVLTGDPVRFLALLHHRAGGSVRLGPGGR